MPIAQWVFGTTTRAFGRRVATLLIAGASFGCSSATSPSNITLGSDTETMLWDLKNSCSVQVDVQLFDKTTGGVWPSSGTVYRLDAGEQRVERIRCNADAKVCFGAGVRGDHSSFWGVSLSNSQACSDCCHVCDGSDPTPIRFTSDGPC